MDEILLRSREAVVAAAPPGSAEYVEFCAALRARLHAAWPAVLAANAEDLRAIRATGAPEALVDRIRLGEKELAWLDRLTGDVADALDRLGAEPTTRHQAGPLTVRRVTRPLGVVLMIYEARPTVSVEGALLPVVMGNAVLLKGGTEIAATNRALAPVVRAALVDANLPPDMVHLLDNCGRAELRTLLTRSDVIDVLLPRGGPSLIDFCRSASRIPVIASGGGTNHLYAHHSADPGVVAGIVLDSKLPEPTACNTLETVLCDEGALSVLADAIVKTATGLGVPCTLKVPQEYGIHGTDVVTVLPLTDVDLGREYLDRTVALRPVTGLAEAVTHIRTHGSGHTEGVVADDPAVVEDFCRHVDAATLVVNGSLRLHDGPTMGLGPEIAISTGRLQVRGPVGLTALTTHSWVVEASGTLRASVDAAGTERG
jgi:glutamate-5-semialdehyde dehydrogenase